MTQKLKTVFERVENIVGKGENAGYHHFHLFPQCFQKVSFTGPIKAGIVDEELQIVVALSFLITIFKY